MKKALFLICCFAMLFSCKKEEPQRVDPVVRMINTQIGNSPYSVGVSGYIDEIGNPRIGVLGFCLATHPEPTIEDSVRQASIDFFVSQFDNLEPETEYWIRPFAGTRFGTFYGESIHGKTSKFTSLPVYPDSRNIEVLDTASYHIMVYSLKSKLLGATDTMDGRKNVSRIPDGSPVKAAAEYCENLVSKGHDDWYLPAERELLMVINNVTQFRRIPLHTGLYWSSTEVSADSAVAVTRQPFVQSVHMRKAQGLNVICVRSLD